MHFFRPISYKRLPSHERTDVSSIKEYRPLSNIDDDNPHDPVWLTRRLTRASFLLYLTIIVASGAMISSSLVAFIWIRSRSLQTCLAQTSSYCTPSPPCACENADTTPQSAPALEVVKYHETDFANAFDERSPYRGPPTVELEQAWEDLWNRTSTLLPKARDQ